MLCTTTVSIYFTEEHTKQKQNKKQKKKKKKQKQQNKKNIRKIKEVECEVNDLFVCLPSFMKNKE